MADDLPVVDFDMSRLYVVVLQSTARSYTITVVVDRMRRLEFNCL